MSKDHVDLRMNELFYLPPLEILVFFARTNVAAAM
jgi:hypothetical protein